MLEICPTKDKSDKSDIVSLSGDFDKKRIEISIWYNYGIIMGTKK